MKNWTPYISDHTINAICWTLIHSLWIGLAIALLSGLVITVTRKSSAVLRYNLLCGILVLFSLSVCLMFCLEMWTPANHQGPLHVGQFILAPDNHMIIVPATTVPYLSLTSRMVVFLDEYANIIFLVWLLLFVLKSLKMAGGLFYIQRIRNYRIHDVSEEFKHKIEMFSRQIGIRRAVRLVQSELVKVPVAVGWLKPMILLPMGILLQLSPEQLDSILWHELAHIRRRDYLVNILQGLVETVFFFNPGLLWLSSLIRTEREACCDDMVLTRMNRKANYLEALLAFGYEDNSRLSLAMSIGSGNQLRDRMKRMINQENKRLNVVEKVVLIAGIVILSAFTGLPKTTQNAVKQLVNVMIKKPDHIINSKATALDPLKKQTIPQSADLAVIDTLRGRDTLVRFRSVLFKQSDADMANNDIRAEDTTGKKYHFIILGGKLVAMDINGEKVKESDLPKYQYLITQIDVEVLEKRHIRETDMAGFKANHPDAKFKGDKRFDKRHYVDSLRMKSSDRLRLEKNVMSFMNSDLQVMHERFRNDSISYADQKNRALNVIADLVHDKAVPDPASVKWFGLSNTEFLVNGQKQNDEMQQRYKAKYGIYKDYGLYYGPVQMHGVGVFIDVTDPRPPLPPRPRQPKEPRQPGSGYVRPKYADSNAWKLRQLIKQQQSFAADQVKKRGKLIKNQQVFASDQAKKREQIMQQQQALRADQEFEGLKRQWVTKSAINLQPVITSVISDLVSANVIHDKSDLIKFNLTNSALMVNGIKQPEELHKKLRAKYLERPDYSIGAGITADPNFGLHFNAINGNRGLGITEGPDSP
jgi:bla regulator protein BlaR1